MQINDSIHRPPKIESMTQWADTNGPFPMLVKCIAASGCYISNRHNDSFSSHGDEVQQRGCLVLAQGESHVLNITFTQVCDAACLLADERVRCTHKRTRTHTSTPPFARKRMQNPLNGMVAIWDPSQPVTEGSPPGSGIAIAADTNCPACRGGVFPLFTPILGGSYVRMIVGLLCWNRPASPALTDTDVPRNQFNHHHPPAGQLRGHPQLHQRGGADAA
jgi:hypothetical protein